MHREPRISTQQFAPLAGALSPTWLARFGEWLMTIFHDHFDDSWSIAIDPDRMQVRAHNETTGTELIAPIHPGAHVVIPSYAAERVVADLERRASVASMARGRSTN